MTANPGQGSDATGLTDRRREREALDRLVGAVQARQSRSLVIRGDPGVGKSVLLEYRPTGRCRVTMPPAFGRGRVRPGM